MLCRLLNSYFIVYFREGWFLTFLSFSAWTFVTQLYRPVGETPCHFVSSLDELVELNEKLLNCQEFAIDLEVICK